MTMMFIFVALMCSANLENSLSYQHYQELMDHMEETGSSVQDMTQSDFVDYFNQQLNPSLVELQKRCIQDVRDALIEPHDAGNMLITTYDRASDIAKYAGHKKLAGMLLSLPLKLSAGSSRTVAAKMSLAAVVNEDEAVAIYEALFDEIYERGFAPLKLGNAVAARLYLGRYYDTHDQPGKAAIHYRAFLSEKRMVGSPHYQTSLEAGNRLIELSKSGGVELDEDTQAYLEVLPTLIDKGPLKVVAHQSSKQNRAADNDIIGKNFLTHINRHLAE